MMLNAIPSITKFVKGIAKHQPPSPSASVGKRIFNAPSEIQLLSEQPWFQKTLDASRRIAQRTTADGTVALCGYATPCSLHLHGLNCETRRRLSVLIALPHVDVGRFDMATEAVSIEQRVRGAVLR